MERKLSILDAYTQIPKRIGVMSMTREEVKYASKDYVNYLLDKQEYHNEKYTDYDIKQAFEKGAEWADEHPKSPWISVKEDLPCNHPELMDSSIYTVRVFVSAHEDVLITRMIYRSRKWEWFWNGEITHWMPIPILPEE